jgi:hypothetical protein
MWECLTCHKTFKTHKGAVAHQATSWGHRIRKR